LPSSTPLRASASLNGTERSAMATAPLGWLWDCEHAGGGVSVRLWDICVCRSRTLAPSRQCNRLCGAPPHGRGRHTPPHLCVAWRVASACGLCTLTKTTTGLCTSHCTHTPAPASPPSPARDQQPPTRNPRAGPHSTAQPDQSQPAAAPMDDLLDGVDNAQVRRAPRSVA
jgi:hypothetical protein